MPDLRPGSAGWEVYRDLAEAVRGAGVDLQLVSTRPEAVGIEGLHHTPARDAPALDRLLAPLTRNPRLLRHVLTLRDAVRRLRPDALYIEQVYPLGYAGRLALRLAGATCPLVLAPSGEDVLVQRDAGFGFRRHAFPRRAVRLTLRDAAAVRCISPLVQRTVERLSSAPRQLIPASVSAATVRWSRRDEDAVRTERARRRLELDEHLGLAGAPVVVALGRLHPVKGLHLLVDAVAGLPGVALAVAGSSNRVRGFGDYGEYLERRAREVGMADRYRRLEWVPHDRVLPLLAGAAVVAAPSLLESQNRVCIEAVAAGSPFVLGSGAGLAELVPETGVGCVVDPTDGDALRRSLRRILDGDWLRDPRTCRDFVARFAPERVGASLAELLHRAVGRPSGAAGGTGS